ncbi:MAG: hypothetical protein Q7S96_05005 [bacterium]|nr:hypothetical protein [bacterium]
MAEPCRYAAPDSYTDLTEALRERPWRPPHDAQRRERPSGLTEFFARFADPQTSEIESCDLIERIDITADAAGRNLSTMTGRNLRLAIVEFLCDIGSELPNSRESGLTRGIARKTLATRIAPILVQGTEHLQTLVTLASFYSAQPFAGSGRVYVSELSEPEQRIVCDMLERAYEELRRHYRHPSSDTNVEADAFHAMRWLNTLFSSQRWWDSLAHVRAIEAVPDLYSAVQSIARYHLPPLQFPWWEVELLRRNGQLTDHAFIASHHEDLRDDLVALLIATSQCEVIGRLAAMLVSDIEDVHPGIITGTAPPSETPPRIESGEHPHAVAEPPALLPPTFEERMALWTENLPPLVTELRALLDDEAFARCVNYAVDARSGFRRHELTALTSLKIIAWSRLTDYAYAWPAFLRLLQEDALNNDFWYDAWRLKWLDVAGFASRVTLSEERLAFAATFLASTHSTASPLDLLATYATLTEIVGKEELDRRVPEVAAVVAASWDDIAETVLALVPVSSFVAAGNAMCVQPAGSTAITIAPAVWTVVREQYQKALHPKRTLDLLQASAILRAAHYLTVTRT